MENALLVGLSRQIALDRELGIVANNIANLDTTGYKADATLFEQYLMPGARDDSFGRADRQISFVQDRGTWHDFREGAVRQTGNPLDVFISGEAFLTVQTPRGERYTRNGALQINAAGQLVNSSGDPVLGDNGPIVLQPTDSAVAINPDGSITVREGAATTSDAQRGKLRLVRFDEAQRLQKEGSSLFAAPAGVTPQPAPSSVRVIQGAVEQSNVRSVVEMARMIEITRTYTQVAGLIQQASDQRRSAIDKLAEVPA
jgi:flagellar basal-body rod protein FlgF